MMYEGTCFTAGSPGSFSAQAGTGTGDVPGCGIGQSVGAMASQDMLSASSVCITALLCCAHPLILFTDCLCGCVGVQLPFPIYTGISVVDGWSWFDRRAFDMLPPGLELLEDDFYGLVFKKDHYELRKWHECVTSLGCGVLGSGAHDTGRAWPFLCVSGTSIT